MTNRSAPRTQVLVFDGFDDLDAVGPLEVLVAAGFPASAVRPAAHAEGVLSAHGLGLRVDGELSEDAELVIVPGGGWLDQGSGARDLVETPLPARLAALHAQGVVMAGVCTGVMLLGVAGITQGRRAVTNHHALEQLLGFGADVQRDARVVDDGDLITCGGPSAGLDLAIHLVTRYLGEDAGRAAADRIEYEPRSTARPPASVPGSPS